MSRQRSTFTQQLKSDIQKNPGLHQESVDILRRVQPLLTLLEYRAWHALVGDQERQRPERPGLELTA